MPDVSGRAAATPRNARRAGQMNAQLQYSVTARRVSETESRANCKEAELVLDTALAGRVDAFNPVELLLASIAACMLKGIERVADAWLRLPSGLDSPDRPAAG